MRPGPRWTDEIIEETVRTLRDKLGRTPEQTDHLVNELRNHFPDAWVEQGYRDLIPAMTNQEKDRHVLAAAVKTPCEVIVTYNLKHFPEEPLARSVKYWSLSRRANVRNLRS